MKHSLEKHLANAIEEAPIHLLEKLKNQPVQRMSSHNYITRQEKGRSKIKWRIPVFALATMFIGFFVLWVMPLYTVEGTLYVDINPSIQISYNRREEVLSVDTLQPQDHELIQNISIKDKDIYVLMEEIMAVLPRREGSEDLQPALLVSVQNKDSQKGQTQSHRLNTLIHEYLQKQRLQQVVLSQNITHSHTLEEYARQYNISMGKMTFVRNLIILNPSFTMEELAPLPIDELVKRSVETGLNLKEIIEVEEDLEPLYREQPSDERKEGSTSKEPTPKTQTPSPEKKKDAPARMLTKEQARNIVLKRVKGSIKDIELDEDDGRWFYELEIQGQGKEYEIRLDAYSGSILEIEVEENDEDDDNDD